MSSICSRRCGNRSLTSVPHLPPGLNSQRGLSSGRFSMRQPAADAERLAVGREQLRLGVERVHVRHAAGREQEDDALRLRREVRRLRRERIGRRRRRVGRQQLRQDAGQQQRAADQRAEDVATGRMLKSRHACVASLNRRYTNSLLQEQRRGRRLAQASRSARRGEPLAVQLVARPAARNSVAAARSSSRRRAAEERAR